MLHKQSEWLLRKEKGIIVDSFKCLVGKIQYVHYTVYYTSSSNNMYVFDAQLRQ